MKNNRCGPCKARGDPQGMFYSRGDPPIESNTRGDPPWIYASRGDPPDVIRARGHPPEPYLARGRPPDAQKIRNSSFKQELIFRILGGHKWLHERGMPENEQSPSRSHQGESISLRGKGLAEKETYSYLKYTITNDVDRSILAPSPFGEGWGGALK